MKSVHTAAIILCCSSVGFAQARPAPRKPDACALITKADVEAALHQPVAKGPTPGGMGPMSTCEFEIGSGASKGHWNLQMMGCDPGSFKSLASAFSSRKSEAIAGIGDEAAWSGDQLTIRKGSQCLMVPGWNGADSLDAAKTLGAKAIARLSK